ncbi:DNA-binding protein [Acinetobacter sp. ULE_I092]|uniref:DNA-binding protein n=1 Tax=Acinetobacter sp. ULE_I092 TaxID=3373075 RepID=UPI003AF55BA0
MSRKTKLSKMTEEEKILATKIFWESPSDATFPPTTIALVFNVSIQWLQLKRCEGGGIPFTKGLRKISYTKGDVVKYFEGHKLTNTI